jgi:fatty acid desaturase
MCGNKREGLEVVPDYMIGIIRWFKHLTGSEKRYRLVVCRECFENYRKARHRYQRRQVAYLIIGIVFAAVLVMFNPVLGVIYGIVIIFFMYLISQLNWMPALRMPETKKSAPIK